MAASLLSKLDVTPLAHRVTSHRTAPFTAVVPLRYLKAPLQLLQVERLTDRAAVVTHAKKGKGGGGDSDNGKGGKGGKGGKDASGASSDEIAKLEKEAKADAEDRMKKAIGVVGDNFNTIRTGRANPAMLDRVMVDMYGAPVPLKSIASISVPEAQTLLVSPFDPKSLKAIEKALNESDVGITPNNDGQVIRLNLPTLTQERRVQLSKSVAKFGEEGKVAVRNVRKDVMKKLDKVDGFSKDAKKALEDAIQKLTDVYVKKVDDMVKVKTDELMKV